VQTLKTIPEVDQTFGGAFSPETPSPDRTNPPCAEGTPPPWTQQGGGGG
jgi:branched-chain amino acid transport system substrate-binding protein